MRLSRQYVTRPAFVQRARLCPLVRARMCVCVCVCVCSFSCVAFVRAGLRSSRPTVFSRCSESRPRGRETIVVVDPPLPRPAGDGKHLTSVTSRRRVFQFNCNQGCERTAPFADRREHFSKIQARNHSSASTATVDRRTAEDRGRESIRASSDFASLRGKGFGDQRFGTRDVGSYFQSSAKFPGKCIDEKTVRDLRHCRSAVDCVTHGGTRAVSGIVGNLARERADF